MSDLISRQAAIDAISCNILVTGKQNAELVGCHRQTVRRILKETGKLDEAKLDTGKVMALHQAGWSVNSIAGEMGCSSQCIEKTLQEKDQNNESEML